MIIMPAPRKACVFFEQYAYNEGMYIIICLCVLTSVDMIQLENQ